MAFQAHVESNVAAALGARLPRVLNRVRNGLNRLNYMLQGHIVGSKLQGQVLQHRTGKLGGSVHVLEATINGMAVEGSVEGAGGPASYGQVHETGGTFTVPEHTRRTAFNVHGETVRMLTRMGHVRKSVVGVEVGKVREHTVTFPMRSFMRSSVEDNRQQIFDGVYEALVGGMRGTA